MKVWEKLNQLKGTTETRENIRNWAYMNRICPIIMDEGLELEEGEYPKELEGIAWECCKNYGCSIDCLDAYLDSEV